MEAVENDIKRGRPAEPEDRFKVSVWQCVARLYSGEVRAG